MDMLGQVMRDFLKCAHDDAVRNARALAGELKAEGMTKSQIEEMLFASGFEAPIVREAMEQIPGGKK